MEMSLAERICLDRPSSRHKLDNKNDKCQHQQDVDKIADGRSRKSKAECPKYQKNYQDCPKHSVSPYFPFIVYRVELTGADSLLRKLFL